MTRIYVLLWKHFFDTHPHLYRLNVFRVFEAVLRLSEKALSEPSEDFSCSCLTLHLSNALCLNMLIITTPFRKIETRAGKLECPVLIQRLCGFTKRLLFAGQKEAALEMFLVSLFFVRRIAPQCLRVWQAEFGGWKYLEPLLVSHYADIFSILFANVYAFSSKNTCDFTGVLLLKDLLNSLQVSEHPDIIVHYIRLLTIGTPSTLFLVTRNAPLKLASSFICLCVNLCVPLRHLISSGGIYLLADTYIRVWEESTENLLTAGVLVNLHGSILEVFAESEEPIPNYTDIAFVIQVFSEAACKNPFRLRFRSAMLLSLICPCLNMTSQLRNIAQVSIAIELSSAYIRLVSGLSDPEAVCEAFNALSSLDRIIATVAVSSTAIIRVIDAFAEYLTTPDPILCSAYPYVCSTIVNTKRSLLESLMRCYLQLTLRCLQVDSEALHSSFYLSLWARLWSVLSRTRGGTPVSQLAPLTLRFDSLLRSLAAVAENLLVEASSLPVDLRGCLLGVLSDLSCELGNFSTANIPFHCADLAILDSLISLSSGLRTENQKESHKLPEELDSEQVEHTLSVPMSYYLAEEEKLQSRKKPQVEKHIRLFFFIFNRFLHSCHLRKPDEITILKRFLLILRQLRQSPPADLPSSNDPQIRAWLSDIASDGLRLLRSLELAKCNDSTKFDVLLDLLEALWTGGKKWSISALVEATNVQISGLLRLTKRAKFCGIKLRLLRLLTKWSCRTNPLEPEHYLEWPRYFSIPWPTAFKSSRIGIPPAVPTFQSFAFARSSISLEHWGQTPDNPLDDPPTSTIWPSHISRRSASYQEKPASVMSSTAPFCASPNGVVVSLWYKFNAVGGPKPRFDASAPISESALGALASRGDVLHMLTLEESQIDTRTLRTDASNICADQSAATFTPSHVGNKPSFSCWSIEIWLVPGSRGIFTRIRRRCRFEKEYFVPDHCHGDSFAYVLSSDVYFPNVLDPNDWGHMLFSLLWNKNTTSSLTGMVATTINGTLYREKEFTLFPVLLPSCITGTQSTRYTHHLRTRLVTTPCSLSLWMGHDIVMLENSGKLVAKAPFIFTGGFLVFSGDVLKHLVLCAEGLQAQLKDLALCLALCGPSWDGTPPVVSADSRIAFATKGRFYLRALLHRLRPKFVGRLFSRGQRMLNSGSVAWVRTLCRLAKHNLLITTGCPSLSVVNWTVRIPSNQGLPASSPATEYSNEPPSSPERNVYSTYPKISTSLWMADPVANVDIEVTPSSLSPMSKCGIDGVVASLGGIDFASYLTGSLVCERGNSDAIIVASLTFLLSLTRHSVVAAGAFYQPLSGELNPSSLNSDCNGVHLATYGLCLLSSLINRLCSRKTILPFQRVLTEYSCLKSNDEQTYLLTDPELVVCQLSFSSSEGLPALLNSLSECFCTKSVRNTHVLACNIATCDRFGLVETALTGFRLCFSTSDELLHCTGIPQEFEASLAALGRLVSKRLAVCPSSVPLLTSLLHTLVSVDPDLYHSAATRAFGAKDRQISARIDLVSLAQVHKAFVLSTTLTSSFGQASLGKECVSQMSGLFDSTPTQSIFKDDEDAEILEDDERSPVASTLTSYKTPPATLLTLSTPIPWVSLQPALALEGASRAEAETLAKFRENLRENDQMSSYKPSTLFDSCHNLADFVGLDVGEDTHSSSRLCMSLPDIYMKSMASDPISSSSATMDIFLSIRDETHHPGDSDTLCGIGQQTPVISSMQIVQRRRLSALILSCLVEFWQIRREQEFCIDSESNSILSAPPFWLVYHLAGHPCVRFREQALSLYCSLLSTPARHGHNNALGKLNGADYDRILAKQFLTEASFITFPCCSSTTQVQWTHDCSHNVGLSFKEKECSHVSFAHIALTSPALVAAACNLVLEFEKPNMQLVGSTVASHETDGIGQLATSSTFLSLDGEKHLTSVLIALSLLASSLVDTIALQLVSNERPNDSVFSTAVTNLQKVHLDRLASFFASAKVGPPF
uniref:BEACH domain-containing protein n=1 Tax=Mesocestoides corti TaxID=53468 RepID=A0A5K3F4P4_MESCO